MNKYKYYVFIFVVWSVSYIQLFCEGEQDAQLSTKIDYDDIVLITNKNTGHALFIADNKVIPYAFNITQVPRAEALWRIASVGSQGAKNSGPVTSSDQLALQNLKSLEYFCVVPSLGSYKPYDCATQGEKPTISAGQLSIRFSSEKQPTQQALQDALQVTTTTTDKPQAALTLNLPFFLIITKKNGDKTERSALVMKDNQLITTPINTPAEIVSVTQTDRSQWIISIIRPRSVTYGDIVTISAPDDIGHLWASDTPIPATATTPRPEYSIGATLERSNQSQWQIVPPLGLSAVTMTGQIIRPRATTFMLQNKATGRFLCDDLTDNQGIPRYALEKKTYGFAMAALPVYKPSSFSYDKKSSYEWYIDPVNSSEQLFRSKTPLRLVNKETGRFLYSQADPKKMVQEVSMRPKSSPDKEIFWQISTVQTVEPILAGNIVRLQHVLSDKYLGITDNASEQTQLFDKNNADCLWIIGHQSDLEAHQDTHQIQQSQFKSDESIILTHLTTRKTLYASASQGGNTIRITTPKKNEATDLLLRSWALKLSAAQKEFTSGTLLCDQQRLRLYHRGSVGYSLYSNPSGPTKDTVQLMNLYNETQATRHNDFSLWKIELVDPKDLLTTNTPNTPSPDPTTNKSPEVTVATPNPSFTQAPPKTEASPQPPAADVRDTLIIPLIFFTQFDQESDIFSTKPTIQAKIDYVTTLLEIYKTSSSRIAKEHCTSFIYKLMLDLPVMNPGERQSYTSLIYTLRDAYKLITPQDSLFISNQLLPRIKSMS